MEGEGGQARDGVLLNILKKIEEAYTWVTQKVRSLFQLFSESITDALLSLKSFAISCGEKLRDVLSWINTQVDKLSGKKMIVNKMVVYGVPEEKSLLDEMKKLVKNLGAMVNSSMRVATSPEMALTGIKLKGFIDLVDGFIELLDNGLTKPVTLIVILVDGFLLYRSSLANKVGGMMTVSQHKGKAAMAIATVISLILKSIKPVNVMV